MSSLFKSQQRWMVMSWVLFCAVGWVPQRAEAGDLVFLITHQAKIEVLRSWNPASLAQWLGKGSGKAEFSLFDVLDKLGKELKPEENASIDLLALKKKDGTEVLVPRWFVQRVKTLQIKWDGSRLTTFATRRGEVQRLPVEEFSVADLEAIELTSFKARLGTYVLSKRTEPTAVKGEKLFLQTCLVCHVNSQGWGNGQAQVAQKWKTSGRDWVAHKAPHLKRVNWGDDDWRALDAYFKSLSP